MTPVRSWLARLFGASSTPSQLNSTGSSLTRRSRKPHAQLELESLEDRNLLSGTGLTAQYYNGANFNTLKLTRTDPSVNFIWGGQAPISGLAGTNFSVRWTGYVQPQYSQDYTFYTRSDDGVRLYVNGVKIIDNWPAHSVTENSGTIRLVAGQKYKIEMDYYQGAGSSTAQLMWSSASLPKQLISTGNLYPNVATPAPNPGPTAKLTAANVTTAGATSYLFTVTYTDADGVNLASLKTGNIRVTGPNGFNQLATFVKANVTSNGTPRTATYRITPPGNSWDVKDNGTYTVTLQSGQVADIRGNLTTGGVIGSFQVSAPGVDWFTTNLHDTGVRNEVRALAGTDHALSRTEMITLLRSVEAGNVTASEIIDLQTVVNTTYLSETAAVRDLAHKVVYGDPANMHYLGQYLGNLHAGSSSVQMEDLVRKWFLGMDHPAASSGTSYVLAAGTLFGTTGPRYTDIRQGSVGDCYLLAGLGEIAYRTPNSIRDMFTDNGDGTYTVRFYHNGTPTYVTVDKYLPQSGGDFFYANFQASIYNSSNKLWVALAEKAYAELAESGWSRPSNTTNSYGSINLGWEGDVVHQATNRNVAFNSMSSSSATYSAIVSAFQSGRMVALDTKPTTSPDIVPNHVYVMIGFNATSHAVTLYNPWGNLQVLSPTQIAANFEGWSENLS